jgi:serine/threonine-protein kinase
MQFESFDINEFYTHLKSIIESQGSLRQQLVEQFQHKYPDKSDWLDALPQGEESAIEIGFTPEIPQYKLIKLIGSGANGRVFLATDRSGQQCAVKIPNMWLNEDQLSRFYHEAKVLSRMSHPNIAQVKDFGDFMVADQKLPFLVMDYIPGIAIDQYVQNHNLSQADVIDLIIEVLEALQFAHHKSVIHRDIKPDNIIVKENGQPVLLDFGIATLGDDATQMLTQLTGTGDIVGTLAYMSPEQITGSDKSDLRSDIYAMGVVIYQLLSGRLPISVDASQFFSAVHDIVHQTPPSLTTINGDIDDGLAAVVHHAMEKNVKHRYQSVSELVKDLTAWLHHEPLSVSNLSSWYWLKQAARKNKALVTGASLAVLGLLTGLIFAVSFGLKEQQARALAERKAESNRQVVAFVNTLFLNANPGHTMGETLTVKQVLQGSRYDINHSLSSEPMVAAQIRLILGNAYESLDMINEAMQHYNKGIELVPKDDLLYFQLGAQQVVALGRASLSQKHIAAIDQYSRELNDYLKKGINEYEANQLINRLNIEKAGHYAVISQYEKALAILNQLLESPFNTTQMNIAIGKNIGYIERKKGQLQQAEKRFTSLVKDTTDSLGPLHPITLDLQQELALTLRMQNRIDEALSLYDQVVKGMEKSYGENSLSTLLAKINKATAFMYAGNFEQADSMTSSLLPAMIEQAGSSHRFTVILRNIRAGALQNVGKLDEALSLYQEAIDIDKQSAEPDEHNQINFAHNMATIYFKQQRYDQVNAIYHRIHPQCQKTLGADQPLCVIVADAFAAVAIELGHIEQAKGLLAYSNPALIKIFGENHPRVKSSNERKALLTEATAP